MSLGLAKLFTDDPILRRMALTTPWGFLATGFGAGLLRFAPGTAGTVIAVPPALVLLGIPPLLATVVVMSLFVLGIPLCRMAASALGESDPGAIVWDEIVGFCLAAVLAPRGLAWFLAAFLAFRFFDIVKPWPIGWLDRRVGGGIGIMIDDIVAALYAVLLLRLVEWGGSRIVLLAFPG